MGCDPTSGMGNAKNLTTKPWCYTSSHTTTTLPQAWIVQASSVFSSTTTSSWRQLAPQRGVPPGSQCEGGLPGKGGQEETHYSGTEHQQVHLTQERQGDV